MFLKEIKEDLSDKFINTLKKKHKDKFAPNDSGSEI